MVFKAWRAEAEAVAVAERNQGMEKANEIRRLEWRRCGRGRGQGLQLEIYCGEVGALAVTVLRMRATAMRTAMPDTERATSVKTEYIADCPGRTATDATPPAASLEAKSSWVS